MQAGHVTGVGHHCVYFHCAAAAAAAAAPGVRRQDVPVEYSGEEQAIVAVGLATPRPGVFVEAIQHLLVLATATEVVLLGVCCSPGQGGGNGGGDSGGGPGDACEQLALQPLPLYSAPTDNVTMVSVASTAGGRIFLGGAGERLRGQGWVRWMARVSGRGSRGAEAVLLAPAEWWDAPLAEGAASWRLMERWGAPRGECVPGGGEELRNCNWEWS